MNSVSLLQKPELLRRPQFLLQRLFRFGRTPRAQETIILPWGLPLHVCPDETIGRHVWAFGIFDLIVCEALWRLAEPGETALDVGANVGHMTGLLARRVGPGGRVLSFEPHPDVRRDLQRHVDEWQALGAIALMQVHPFALFNRDAAGELNVPDRFDSNRGLASVVNDAPGWRRVPVEFRRLDSVLPAGQKVGVLKVDVEGAEPMVLEGAHGLLAAGQIRDIVFEDHGPYPSEPMRQLEPLGYTVFSLGLNPGGLAVTQGTQPSPLVRPWDSPSFLATRDPQRALARLTPAGWQCLRGA
jgi:FkbM family methyltransferase